MNVINNALGENFEEVREYDPLREIPEVCCQCLKPFTTGAFCIDGEWVCDSELCERALQAEKAQETAEWLAARGEGWYHAMFEPIMHPEGDAA